MAIVRKLTETGIKAFTEYLTRLADGEKIDPPMHLLTDADSSQELLGTAEVEPVTLDSKLAAAKYLTIQLASLDKSEVDNNVGLWTWLSLFFFDQVCPESASGERKPGEIVRHVLTLSALKYYRHLLAGPCRLWQLHGKCSRVFLYNPLTEHGDFSEQLASRQQHISNLHLIEAVDRLYYDPESIGAGRPKRGALTRTRPGNLRRLVAVIQQFDLTYDMYAMNSEQILTLLPDEFDHWRE
ncbi:MAG: hypothetical protein J5I93_09630 [Pirellulaceae bacterium]|nr:hypothetical protein [Pirellulaceae bacterium]